MPVNMLDLSMQLNGLCTTYICPVAGISMLVWIFFLNSLLLLILILIGICCIFSRPYDPHHTINLFQQIYTIAVHSVDKNRSNGQLSTSARKYNAMPGKKTIFKVLKIISRFLIGISITIST